MKRRLGFKNKKGNAMIEFALLWGVMFPVLAGTAQFGNAFYQYDGLCTTVRNAARYASVQTYHSQTSAVPTDFQTSVRNMVRYENPNPPDGAKPLFDVPPANILVEVAFVNNVPDMVTVTIVQYNIDTVIKTFTINNKPKTSFPYLGRWDPA